MSCNELGKSELNEITQCCGKVCDWCTGRLSLFQTRARPSSADLQHAREKKTSRGAFEAKRGGSRFCMRGAEHTHTQTYTNADRGALCPHTSWVELFVRKRVCVCVWSHMSANYAAVADHWIIHTYWHNVSDRTASVCVCVHVHFSDISICVSQCPQKAFPGLSLFLFSKRERRPTRALFHMSQ